MRSSLALLALAVAASALASGLAEANTPRPPIWFGDLSLEGTPAVGNDLVLHLQISSCGAGDLRVRLHGSSLVQVIDLPWDFPSDQRCEGLVDHSWRLRISGQGLWTLALSATVLEDGSAARFEASERCCGYGWSNETTGQWSMTPSDLAPDVDAPEGAIELQVTNNEGQAVLYYNVTAAEGVSGSFLSVAPANRSDNLRLDFDHVSRWMGILQVPDHEKAEFEVRSDWEAFPRPIALPPGPTGPGRPTHTYVFEGYSGVFHCQNLRLAREGDQVWTAAAWPCDAPAPSLTEDVPAPLALTLPPEGSATNDSSASADQGGPSGRPAPLAIHVALLALAAALATARRRL